jgi:HD superfamily phosphohydrolase
MQRRSREMKIKDRAYGDIIVDEPVIIELINSPIMQRLKGINQGGAPVFLDPKRDVNRFEHSVGVWYLLKRYGAKLEEQIAGLLHDTPHTAFSHVIDFVYPNADHTFHEKFTEKVILTSSVPEILRKYGIEVNQILNKENFALLDAELPDLSADRIDYFLRDTRVHQLFPDRMVGEFMEGIFVRGQKFYFKDKSLASLYAILFLNAGRLLWLDPDSHGSFFLLAEALRRAIEMGEITEEDFFKTDKEVFEILTRVDDPIVKKYVSRLVPGTRFKYTEESKAEFVGPNKPRVVDPWVETGAELYRLSELEPRFREMFEHFKKTYKVLGVVAV